MRKLNCVSPRQPGEEKACHAGSSWSLSCQPLGGRRGEARAPLSPHRGPRALTPVSRGLTSLSTQTRVDSPAVWAQRKPTVGWQDLHVTWLSLPGMENRLATHASPGEGPRPGPGGPSAGAKTRPRGSLCPDPSFHRSQGAWRPLRTQNISPEEARPGLQAVRCGPGRSQSDAQGRAGRGGGVAYLSGSRERTGSRCCFSETQKPHEGLLSRQGLLPRGLRPTSLSVSWKSLGYTSCGGHRPLGGMGWAGSVLGCTPSASADSLLTLPLSWAPHPPQHPGPCSMGPLPAPSFPFLGRHTLTKLDSLPTFSPSWPLAQTGLSVSMDQLPVPKTPPHLEGGRPCWPPRLPCPPRGAWLYPSLPACSRRQPASSSRLH